MWWLLSMGKNELAIFSRASDGGVPSGDILILLLE
jgi:hypothetical protein